MKIIQVSREETQDYDYTAEDAVPEDFTGILEVYEVGGGRYDRPYAGLLYKTYYKNGHKHRGNGPATIFYEYQSDEEIEYQYWINGEFIKAIELKKK